MADIIKFPNVERRIHDNEEMVLSFGIDIYENGGFNLVSHGLNKGEIDALFSEIGKILEARVNQHI